MSESNSYGELVGRVLSDLFVILEKWKMHFASGFEDTCQSAELKDNPAAADLASKAIKDLVATAKRVLNERGRVGEASLFVRDPREDRLVLVTSTSRNLEEGTASTKQVKDLANYFDRNRKCFVYPLFDRLAEAKVRESEWACESRGLTGWVAVAGHHLIVNGEYGKQGLVSLAEDRPETQGACETYGRPMWGHHIAEAPIGPGRAKRYIAVPVRSSADSKRTIGVLRYACPSAGKELSDADLVLLRELAELISATLGLGAATTRAFRGSHIALHKDHLRRTYDFRAFLAFLTKSLRSSIASVYLDIGGVAGSQSRLRLVEAFGIRDSVAALRNDIQDYLPKDAGFTRWLYDKAPNEPTVEPSVHVHPSWRGKNTSLFYGEHFTELVEAPERTKGQPTEVARHYTIKIIGIPLFFCEERIGVLKVELPNTFDDSRHYDKADQAFLTECAATLGEVLGEFRLFLRGEWFIPPNDSVHTIVNVTRMAAELLRTRVISPSEAPQFWEQLVIFVNERENDVADEMREVVNRLSPAEKEELRKSHSWAEKFRGEVGSFSRDVITEVLAKLFVRAGGG